LGALTNSTNIISDNNVVNLPVPMDTIADSNESKLKKRKLSSKKTATEKKSCRLTISTLQFGELILSKLKEEKVPNFHTLI
jgi:hypothetical protein